MSTAGRPPHETPPHETPPHETVTDILRRGIMAGTFPGGTRLIQARIADELGVGRGTVRGALRTLETEGLVRMDPARGALVHELGRNELVELYEIRKLLEPVATARAAKNASKAAILRASTLITAMDTETDGARFAEYNTEFHRAIEEAGTSPRLAVILANLRAVSALYVARSLLVEPGRQGQANAEHAEILRAVIDRDPEAAADAVLRHLNGTLRALLQLRAADP
jgi:DNA-binding GntR family transcriptional regulator